MQSSFREIVSAVIVLSVVPQPTRAGDLPVTGVSVPELAWVDTLASVYVESQLISGGVVAIMRNGCIIYQRGFGWHDAGGEITIPENALFRIASCTKPLTAAAIRRLDAEGAFGPLGLDRFAFDLGQATGGILPATPGATYEPFPALGDERLQNVTIRRLLEHRGGWNRDPPVGDLTRRECDIADDFDVESPPGRVRTMRWILGQPLEFTPGTDQQYSNVGYLALGLIVEEVTGQSLVSYLRSHILTPDLWVPHTDLRQGRRFWWDQSFREVWYNGDGSDVCVYPIADLDGCSVVNLMPEPYGTWDHEARVGQGGLVVSAATMLRFLERYHVQVFSPDIGMPLGGLFEDGAHNGALGGINAYAWQRTDGINVFIALNRAADPGNYAAELANILDPGLDAQSVWPTECVDGFWAYAADPTGYSIFGSFDHPFGGVQEAFTLVGDGSRVNLFPHSFAWTGTLSTKLMLRAPFGTARIGE